jgi:hypothetical protein
VISSSTNFSEISAAVDSSGSTVCTHAATVSTDHASTPCRNGVVPLMSFPYLKVCLSRACLGKIVVLMQRGEMKRQFPYLSVVVLLLLFPALGWRGQRVDV